MHTIHFVKTLKYNLNPRNTDIFDYLSKLTLQKIDPPSTARACFHVDAGIILYSPLRRVIDTLPKTENLVYICIDILREIPFDLKKLCTKNEWEEKGSNIVRQRFKDFFIRDKLPSSREQIFDEAKKILCRCFMESKFNKVTVISHSFRLKIIEAFIKSNGKIESNPKLIHEYILDNKRTYEFGGGFSIKNNTKIM